MVMPSFSLARIPPVYFGPGRLAELPRIAAAFGRSALLVTGRSSLKAGGRLEIIRDKLTQSGLRVLSVTVDAEPSTAFIDSTCAALREEGLDMVIGIGGGSVIDGAKALSAMLPHANSVLDHLEEVGRNVPHSGVKLPFIAVPTTSGTGGEMTKNAVISAVGPEGYKRSLRHDHLIPDAVIVDPELMLTCPPSVTAACGMDAFTQLLEPYLSPAATPLTDALAWEGLARVKECLIPACGDGAGSVPVRAGMAYASMLSGVALANAGLGIVHGLASPIGGFFDIPHGVVCGTLVAEATAANLRALRQRGPAEALAKAARVGALLGPAGADPARRGDAYHCDALVDKLREWTEALRLPRLGAFGIRSSDLERIAEKAGNRNNPVRLKREEICELLAARL